MTLPCDAAAAALRGDLRRSFDFSGVGTFLPFPPLRRRDVCCVEDELEPDDRDRVPFAAAPMLTLSFAWTVMLVFCCFSGRLRTRGALTTDDGPPLIFSVLEIVGAVAESKPALLVSLSVVPALVRAPLCAIRLLVVVVVVLADDCRRFPVLVRLLPALI